MKAEEFLVVYTLTQHFLKLIEHNIIDSLSQLFHKFHRCTFVLYICPDLCFFEHYCSPEFIPTLLFQTTSEHSDEAHCVVFRTSSIQFYDQLDPSILKHVS